MEIRDLPTLNAILNFIAAVLLSLGFVSIRRRLISRHRAFMISAVVFSALFLISYLIYHANVGSIPYQHYNWTRIVYFAILIPHVVLAAVMVPFILAALWYAFRGSFTKHTRITRWLWPVWVFVSVSGVIVYLMLYHY